MRSKSYLFLLLVLGLGVLSAWLFTLRPFNFGLDVRGGIRFTYQMDTSKLTAEQKANLGVIRQKLIGILEGRATGPLGVTEPLITAKGVDQIVIELPGLTDIEKARDAIGTSARIEFYNARNVVGPMPGGQFRTYTVVPSSDPNDPSISFQRRTGGDIIRPGTPEYANVIKGWELILAGDQLSAAVVDMQGGTPRPLMQFSQTGANPGAQAMEQFTRRNPRGNIAAVLDGRVLSIAAVQEGEILRDNAVITGTFTIQYVKRLVDLLNAGSLPVDLVPLSSEKVDPTIGAAALDMIVKAGMIAFALIAVFLIAYYAFPGVVALIALALYVLFTLTVLKLINATFSLAAIAGFILSVGMAVDANILVFERFKEEMKNGRSLMASIQLGFKRAFPAILDSNACTILTSMVLANLGTGPVKGFATTLIIGVAISLFTAVVVTRSLLVFLVQSGIGDNPKWYAVERSWFGERFEAQANENPLKIMEKSRTWFMISLVTVLIGLPFVFMGGLKPNVEFRGGSEAVFSLAGVDKTTNQIRESLERGGFAGTNVKLGTFAPQDLAITMNSLPTLTQGAEQERFARVAELAQIPGASGRSIRELPAEDGRPARLVFTFDAEGLRPSPRDVERALESAGYAGSDAQLVPTGQSEQVAYITVPPNDALSALQSDNEKIAKVAEAAGLDPRSVKGFTEVGPSVQRETINNAILAVLMSSGLIVVYLAVRFGISLGGFVPGLRFGFSAIGALLHDILVVVGVSAAVGFFFGWEISALFITSMLTVIGFSVHDTIVIFDRIRENLRKQLPGEDFKHLVNRSVTQSFGRSINTSMTVIATLIIMLIWGTATPDLKLFCVTMLAGILSGTYSSIYNASPILYLWDTAVGKKKGQGATLMGLAEQEAERVRVVSTAISATENASPSSSEAPKGADGRTYGQVRRRAQGPAPRKKDIDIDEL